jgi:hypothetical protein
MELNEALEKTFGDKYALEETLQQKSADEQSRKELERGIKKLDKSIKNMQEKNQRYNAIMDEFNSLNDTRKFIATLILSGSEGKNDKDFSGYVIALLLQRYRELDAISSRLNFLMEDISADVLSYQQFTFLLNLLETLFFVLREDRAIIRVLETDSTLKEILSPYLVTKKKEVTLDAVDAAAKKVTGYASLDAERAKWQSILIKLEEKNEKFFHKMEIYTSKTFMDSYYGDMGGICLSAYPGQIAHPGFYVQRLANHTDKQIIGMSILYLSGRGFSSAKVNAAYFWQAFAFNPLYSVLSHFSVEQQLYLYLQYRLNMEKVAWMTKLPVVISGIVNSWGLVSNTDSFDQLIKEYELGKPTAKRVKAKGVSIYYDEEIFENALLIIDPRGYEQTGDPANVPSFYAWRELPKMQW